MNMLAQLKKHFVTGFAVLAIAGGSFFVAQNALAVPDYWCPPCSSDFCQGGGGEFVIMVGGNCYCCAEVSMD